MSQIKLAVVIVTPLAFLGSITVSAQEQPPNRVVQTPAPPEPQIQASAVVKDEVYGAYVPFKGSALKPAPAPTTTPTPTPPPTPADSAASTGCGTVPSNLTFAVPKDDVYGAYVPYSGPLLNSCVTNTPAPTASLPPQASPVLKTPPKEQALEVPTVPPAPKPAPSEAAAADAPPPACSMVASTTYGPYVPYTGPPVTACASTQPNSSAAAAQLAEADAPPQPRLASPTANEIALAAPSPISVPPMGEPAAEGSGYIRVVPAPVPEKEPLKIRPFRSVAVGVKADTLGAGVEVATPLSRSFNLRSSFNVMPFNYGFSIDGINYDARFHLQSSEALIDWFPWHNSFHISPGVLYAKNSLSATTSVGPGRSFTLGSQSFINSVDDPANGSASAVYPHKIAPMLLFGFGNIIPRSGSHFSFPIEFGVAYTGTPQMSVALNGTACTTNGCANFATSTQAQTFLKQEVNILNGDLGSYPIYPIVSIGVAYHFYANPHH